MTHSELVARAARWLRNTEHCRLVLTEYVVTYAQEVPDAIGWSPRWHNGVVGSILVECKTSRSDFFSDQAKRHRQNGRMMGSRRWYFVPQGLVKMSEVPAGWGLAEVKGAKVFRTIEAPEPTRPDLRNFDAEMNLLISAAQAKSETWIRNQREALAAPPIDPEIDKPEWPRI